MLCVCGSVVHAAKGSLYNKRGHNKGRNASKRDPNNVLAKRGVTYVSKVNAKWRETTWDESDMDTYILYS